MSLLAVLALRVGQAIPSDRLIDELWAGDAPATARTLLQGFVSKLRTALGPEVIETVGGGYRLALADEAVDANRFRALVEASRNLDGIERESRLVEALNLWRGPPLADLTYAPFAQHPIKALEDYRLTTHEDLIEVRLELGRHRQVAHEIEDLLGGHPYRERLWQLLALALYRSGRQADALEACRRARATLASELGVDPGPELRSLEARVLAQDPTLDGSALPGRDPRAAARAWMPRARRTMTVMFAEVVPTRPSADPEREESEISTGLELIEDAITSHGGTTERSVGGRVVGWFGLVAAREDDPLRALRAAIEARDHGTASATALRVRIGVETGETVTDGTTTSGQVVSTAARLLESAEPTMILIGPAVTRLVRGAAVVTPIDGDHPGAGRLLQVHDDASLIPRNLHAPMVGREAELTRLRTAFSGTVRRGGPTRITVVAEAGLGKSRLARAFHTSIADGATIGLVSGSADRGESLATLQQLIEPVVGAQSPDLAAEPPQDLFATVRRSLESSAERRPLVLTIDDAHWAAAPVLDLFEYLTVSLDAPVMLLCLARPELLDRRPEWAANRARVAVLSLEPLDAESIARIVTDRAQLDVSEERTGRIIELAEGNPLFAEQFVAAVEHDDLDRVPTSLRGLLASRIDLLGPAEKDLLRCAAVAGGELSLPALSALVPDEARPFVRRHLDALQRRRLLQRSRETISFGHDLIRDAAYRSVTRADRARLHERLAEWLDGRSGPRTPHHDAVIGHHLEQAVVNRRQLGVDDDRTDALAIRAGERLASAGSASFGRMDLPAAEDLLSRALQLLPADHGMRTEATQKLAETSLPLGRHTQAQHLLAALTQRPDVTEADRWSARLERTRSLCLTDPGPGGLDAAEETGAQSMAFFDSVDDDTGRAQALFLKGWLELLRGSPVEAEATARRAAEYAGRGGAHREEVASQWLTLQALLEGPTPAEECLERSRTLTRRRGDLHPVAMLSTARLLAMSTRVREADEQLEQARKLMMERLRVPRMTMFIDWATADVHTLATRNPFAIRSYRAALDRAQANSEREHAAELAARLAMLLTRQGRRDEARELASESRSAAPPGYVAVQALSRAAMARSIAEDEPTQALRIAREAVELAPDPMPNLRAATTLQLAYAERACGHARDARRHRDQAARLYREKGNLAAASHIASTSPT